VYYCFFIIIADTQLAARFRESIRRIHSMPGHNIIVPIAIQLQYVL